MDKNQEVRENVSRRYAHAVSKPGDGCSVGSVQKGFVVKLADYPRGELEDLPSDAVVNSFGCGNPLAFSGVKPGETVLDLGCGAGIDLLLAAKRVGSTGRVIGVDMTDEMLAKARDVIEASGHTNIEVRKGLIEDLPVDSDSVDWVISNCVIVLSPEKEKVFTEIARALKPGGRMLVCDLVAQDLSERACAELRRYDLCLARAMSEEQYRSGLQRTGLIDIQIRERITYDVSHLRGLIGAGLRTHRASTCCGDMPDDSAAIETLAQLCEGKVSSVKVFARKPA